MADADGNQLSVTYHGLDLNDFNEKYGVPKPETKTLRQRVRALGKSCGAACEGRKILRLVESKVPAVKVIREYKVREYLLGDIVSGLSVGIFTIPQGMGYAILSAVPPILGLYTCLIPAFIYFLFGNCPHSAMGTMGVSSLIIATAVEKGTGDFADVVRAADPANRSELAALLEEERVAIAVTVTFLSGLVLLVMTVLRLGFIVSYMGQAFVSGYLTGANMRVLTHQVVLCLGLKEHISVHTGFLNYFFQVIDIFKNIKNANVATVIISIVTLAVVLAVKYGINDRFASKLIVPVPVEAIVVVIGILVSHFANLSERYGVKILEHVPQGMPAFTPPSREHARTFAVEAVLLGVVNFVFAGMMAKLFCERHGYTVDNNQELFATGACNTVGGLFSCIGISVSPPRAFLMEMTGGHTQIAYLINGVFILLVLFVIAPLLEALPICILACLVITSCIPLFVHYYAFLTYFKTSKYDFAIWVVTMACTLGVNVDTGLLLGIGFSFIMVVFQSQHQYSAPLARHAEDGVLLDANMMSGTTTEPTQAIRIFKFDCPLYFATLDSFQEKLYKYTVNVSVLKRGVVSMGVEVKSSGDGTEEECVALNKSQLAEDGDSLEANTIELEVTSAGKQDDSSKPGNGAAVSSSNVADVSGIVVDCSCIAFGDTSGARLLAKLRRLYEEKGVRLVLASCPERLLSLLYRVPECEPMIAANALYPSVHDAILALS